MSCTSTFLYNIISNMEKINGVKQLTLVLMDILGKGFCDVVELSSVNYRQYRFDISNTNSFGPIKKFLKLAAQQIQKFAKTQDIPDDNEIYCRNTGSDKLLVPFYFIDEYIHLLYRLMEGLELSGLKEFVSICIALCNSQDDSALQAPDETIERLYKQGLYPKKDYEVFCEFKRRSFRKEYYSVCRDVIIKRNEESSFFDWPLREISNTINTLDWNDDDELVSSRTIERMKGEKGPRLWSSISDIISIAACDRYHKEESILKEFEIFQARILMAYFFENFVYSKTLLEEYEQSDLYLMLKDGLNYKL